MIAPRRLHRAAFAAVHVAIHVEPFVLSFVPCHLLAVAALAERPAKYLQTFAGR